MPLTIFDSRDTAYRRPFGAVASKTPVHFTIRLPKTVAYTDVQLLIFLADQWETPLVFPMENAGCEFSSNLYSVSFTPSRPNLLFYCFRVSESGRITYICKDENNLGTMQPYRGELWQLTVYDAAFSTPDFLKGGTMYQIFPDRFYNSGKPKKNVPTDRKLKPWGTPPEYLPDESGEVTNSDYTGGDLKGIEEKLEYLASLGVTCIYLNPIFEAHSNHRYNTADYRHVDPLLGTDEDFASLCRAAGKLGISVILDGVFSHVGSDSIYFNRFGRYDSVGAYQSKESPYYNWFTFQQYPDKYTTWWGFQTLPEVAEETPSYLEFICGKEGIARHWLSLGASGFRLDVADELPDVFLDRLREAVKEQNPQALILGEVWENASNKSSYGKRRRYFQDKRVDSVMNYPFKNAILQYIRDGGGTSFLNQLMDILENYPAPVIHNLMNSISTHDTERAITALGGESSQGHDRTWQAARQELTPHQYATGKARLFLCCVLQFTLSGTPCIYYGDEIGMAGYRDPFNRWCFDWEHRDEDIFSHMQALGQLRASRREFFAGADFLPVCFTDSICSYLRILGEQGLLIVINRSAKTQCMDIPTQLHHAKLLMGHIVGIPQDPVTSVELRPMDFAILEGRWITPPAR